MRCSITPDLLQAFVAAASPAIVLVSDWIVPVIVLVVTLIAFDGIKSGLIEYWRYYCLTGEHFDHVLSRLFRDGSLFLRVNKYCT